MAEIPAAFAALRDELAQLTAIPAVSGFEEPMIREFVQRIRPHVSDVSVDARGNVIARKAGTGGPVILVECHLDEIWFVVTHVEPTGFLRFAKVGGPTDLTLPA